MPRQRFKFDASVFAIVRSEGAILSIRRSGTGWYDGYWSLPAGAHDGHNSFAESVIRELKEETGLVARVEDCRLLHVQQVFTDRGEWLGLYFEIEAFEGKSRIAEPDKHDRLEWRMSFETGEQVVPYVEEALGQIARGSNISTYYY